MAANQQIFTVVVTKGADRVKTLIEELPEDTTYELRPDTWLVAFEGTTRKLAEHLEIRNGESGSGLVFSIGGYSGRAPSDVWEWLKTHWSANA